MFKLIEIATGGIVAIRNDLDLIQRLCDEYSAGLSAPQFAVVTGAL